MLYLKKYNSYNNTNELKNILIKYYKINGNIDYSESMEIEWDNINKLYKVWVKPYSKTSLYDGKTGLSESHAKGKKIKHPEFQKLENIDYIVLSNTLKNHDPYSWIIHEIGHIIGYRKGYGKGYSKNKNIIKGIPLNDYPNVMDEFCPFYLQMKDLLKKMKPEEVINSIMIDYIESGNHKDNSNELKQFFNLFLNKFFIDNKKKYC